MGFIFDTLLTCAEVNLHDNLSKVYQSTNKKRKRKKNNFFLLFFYPYDSTQPWSIKNRVFFFNSFNSNYIMILTLASLLEFSHLLSDRLFVCRTKINVELRVSPRDRKMNPSRPETCNTQILPSLLRVCRLTDGFP